MDKDAGGHERERIMKGWMISGLLLLALSLMASAHATNKLTLILTNAQGTVVAEKVPYGAVTYTAAYRPYGKQQVGTPQQGPGYTGHVNDSDTGLVYMQARYYDPAVGRFLSVDPSPSSVGNLFNFNAYAYANNNPAFNIDPDGRAPGPPEEFETDRDGRIVTPAEETNNAVNAAEGAGLLRQIRAIDPSYQPPVTVRATGTPYFDDMTVRMLAEDLRNIQDENIRNFRAPEGVPENWEVKPSKKGGGINFIDPTNNHTRIRVMPGNPLSPFEAQREPYVKVQINGVYYDKDGNPIKEDKPGSSPKSHVPLRDFKFKNYNWQQK